VRPWEVLDRYRVEMTAAMVREEQARHLIERAKRGDRSAFDQLFSMVHERLRNHITSRMGASLRSRVNPEDVLQETLMRAFRSIDQFRWQGEDSFCRWLEGLATHRVVDAARAAKRRPEFQIVRDPTAQDVSPSRSARRKERLARLKKSLDSLSPDYQTVVRLARIEGLLIREIAERMGRSESAIKNMLYRAMKELKRSFGDTESLHLGGDGLNAGSGQNDR
jgi:RNA polymerase sigma-70 factor (ECF subfamily)